MVLYDGIGKRMLVADGTVDIAVQGATLEVTLPMLSGILENIVARVVSKAILCMFVFYFLFGVDCFFCRSLFPQTFIVELFFFFDDVVLDVCTCLSIGTMFLIVVLSITLSSITPLLLESKRFKFATKGEMQKAWP